MTLPLGISHGLCAVNTDMTHTALLLAVMCLRGGASRADTTTSPFGGNVTTVEQTTSDWNGKREQKQKT